MNVQIYGCGSAGCHSARAAINDGHHVTVYDSDHDAYLRFDTLYRERYKERCNVYPGQLREPDLVVIATPPATHLSIYKSLPKGARVIIEKPLCLPNEINEFENVSVNYNHLYSPEYIELTKVMPEEIEVNWQESINFIMNAHPWLRFEDSYLSDYRKGGGSAYEHSHGLAAALGFFPDLKIEEIERLTSQKRMKGNYDEYMKIRFVCRGVLVTVTTDFVSAPAKKEIILRAGSGFVISDLGIPRQSSEEQFSLGLRGALGNNQSLNIAKIAVEIISRCHQL